MKILDRYIAKNFIIGYIIAFTVLIGLCVVIDLFVSLDEFAEHHADLGTLAVLKNIYNYYSILPHQQARTFTTRGSFGIYPVTTPDMQVPIAGTIAVPPRLMFAFSSLP